MNSSVQFQQINIDIVTPRQWTEVFFIVSGIHTWSCHEDRDDSIQETETRQYPSKVLFFYEKGLLSSPCDAVFLKVFLHIWPLSEIKIYFLTKFESNQYWSRNKFKIS